MTYILNIETATKNCSVSISENGETLALVELSEQQFNHAEKLHTFIKTALEMAKINFDALSAVAVSKGPGSYTGLRIGVSTAKGLCYALDIPLISVDTLAVLAQQLQISSGYLIPMIDARRMEVFTQLFDKDYNAVTNAEALIVDENAFAKFQQTLHLIGDGALKCKEILTDSKYLFYDTLIYPSAQDMSVLSYNKYLSNEFENVAYFEPYYLKDFMLTTKK